MKGGRKEAQQFPIILRVTMFVQKVQFERERDKVFTCGSISPMATRAKIRPDRSQEAGVSSPSPMWMARAQHLNHLPLLSPGAWEGAGPNTPARTWTSSHTGCWHCRRWLYPTCHNASLTCFILHSILGPGTQLWEKYSKKFWKYLLR